MKTECIIKSLKSDYKDITLSFGIVLFIIIECLFLTKLLDILTDMGVMTAYNLFIVSGAIAIITGFVFNTIPSKEQLFKHGSALSYICGIVPLVAIFSIYCIISFDQTVFTNNPWYPDVNLIFVCYIIVSIVLTPFALAYVRCKE